MKMVCPVCEKKTDVTLKSAFETYTIKGSEISVESEFYICIECGEDFATMEQMDKTLNNGYNIYRKLENIIFPEEIISIRQKYSASQKAFAKILDLGELTINSLEQGSLPSKSISNLIKLVARPVNFIELFEKNRAKLSPFQAKKIEAALSERSVPLYCTDLDKMVVVKEKFTGYNRPDWEKYFAMLQLILFFAQKKLYKMALLKIAFYADFTSYKKIVRSLTGWPYAAIDHGPVPEEYKTILSIAEDMKYLISEPDSQEMGDLFSLTEDFKPDKTKKIFNEKELQIISDVVSALKDKTATELRNLTHDEDAWTNTEHAHKIEYRFAETLKLF